MTKKSKTQEITPKTHNTTKLSRNRGQLSATSLTKNKRRARLEAVRSLDSINPNSSKFSPIRTHITAKMKINSTRLHTLGVGSPNPSTPLAISLTEDSYRNCPWSNLL